MGPVVVPLPPLQLVHTGAACGHCGNLAPGALQRCSGCQRAWFCGAECQRAGWKHHKEACRALKCLLLPEHAPLACVTSPDPDSWFHRCQRLHSLIAADSKANSHLAVSALQFEAHCRMCYATRQDSSTLRPACTKCYWWWACEDHYEAALGEHTQAQCKAFAMANRVQVENRSFCLETGEPLAWAPSSLEDAPPTALPASWADYFQWRGAEEVQGMRGSFFIAITDQLSLPLTALLAMERLGIPRSKPTLTIHVVGASHRDGLTSFVWEEILHQCSGLQDLLITFIGPDVPSAWEASSNPPAVTICPECEARGRTRCHTFSAQNYHEFAACAEYQEPDLLLAFNSNFHQDPQGLWVPTLEHVISHSIPSCVTAYTQEGARLDQSVLEVLHGQVVQPTRPNPFRSELPYLQPVVQDSVYYNSGWYICLKGREPDA